MTDTTTKTKLITPPARAMWVHIFKPKIGKGDDGTATSKFQVDLVFSPEAQATPEFAALKAAANAAAIAKFGDRLKPLIDSGKFVNPFWKAERKLDDDGNLKPGYEAGWVYITAKSQQRPGVVQNTAAGLQPVIDENDVYPGCIVRASVDVYAYDNKSKGVAFGLFNVLKVGDGDRVGGGGRNSAADDFAGVVGAPAGAAGGSAESLF